MLIAINGRCFGSVGGATLAAMIGALAISGDRLVIAQGAAGAILTVATPFADVGAQRIIDALIGAGVALLVSQLLFPAEPVALLRRAEDAATRRLADGLRLTAAALEGHERSLAVEARDLLRRMPGPLADPAPARKSSARTARWSPVKDVAGVLGDREARQRAADRALAAGRTASHAADASSAELCFAWTALRTMPAT